MENINQTIQKKITPKDLEKSYQEAKKDENFEQFIHQFSLPENLLKKYTSQLEESMKEWNHCEHCKNILTCKNKIAGYVYLPKQVHDILTFSYIECKKNQKRKKEMSFLKNITVYESSYDLLNTSFKNVYKEDKNRVHVIKYLLQFIKNYGEEKGLYLHGSFGCGKTYLIVATLRELAKKNIQSTIVFWPEFLRDLKSSFHSSFEEKMDHIKKSPILLIDDIGAENATVWARDEILGPIVQYRMEKKLPTFFTSNLTLEMLEKHLSLANNKVEEVKARRIIERIRQLTVQEEMISENLRK